MASASPRALSSRIVVSASSPEVALTIMYDSRYRPRRSRRTAASTCASSSTTSMTGLFTTRLRCGLVRERQGHPKLGPARNGVELDVGIVMREQTADDVQADSRALANRLGGEERFED